MEIWPSLAFYGTQDQWQNSSKYNRATPTTLVKHRPLLIKDKSNVYLSSPTTIFLLLSFSSAPGPLPVPAGSGRSGHRLNKVTSLKYPEDPGVLFFLGLLSPLNLNKGRVMRCGKGVQIHSTWNYVHCLIYKAEEATKERDGLSLCSRNLRASNYEMNGTITTLYNKYAFKNMYVKLLESKHCI